ncbi:MAG: GHMP kinase [Bacteroides sp. SM23_62_1]|nr:MAG: GHMP kinase [Bacteroides sp. SM23_62_1]
MIIRTRSYPRAALLGNPSDGYFGKTIAFPFDNFSAEVTLFETPELEIVPAEYDTNVFDSIDDLARDVKLYGYYGGIRLLKAAVKRFHDYCMEKDLKLGDQNFTIRYKSDIPYKLGLAGSSAIITACIKALMIFYGIEIPKPILANLVLSVEVNELEISAGLQDRVIQAYESPVYMDFNKDLMDRQGWGDYVPLQADLFKHLYIAYRTDLAEGSEVVHNNFRERYHFNDPAVLNAISEWIELTEKGMVALENGDFDKLTACINRNFDIRRSVMNISETNVAMIEAARSIGASAKFTGSGGAIIGTYANDEMYDELIQILGKMNIHVLKPSIVKIS